MTEPHAPGDHLKVEEVSGYLGGTLSPTMRDRAGRHLADCEECTAEVVAVHRLRRLERSPGRWIGATAAAAAVAGLVMVGPGLIRRPVGDPLVRGSEPSVAIAAVRPSDGAELEAAGDFVWQGVAGATAYRVTVSRQDGDSVWAVSTSDTTTRASEELLRAGPGRYYWYVDALLEDGRSVSGPVHEFRLGP
jgi:hypothetical protein